MSTLSFGAAVGAGPEARRRHRQQDALGLALHVVVLSVAQAPKEGPQADHPHDEGDRDQERRMVMPAPSCGRIGVGRVPGPGMRSMFSRNELAITRIEEADIAEGRDQTGDRQGNGDAVVVHRQAEVLPDQGAATCATSCTDRTASRPSRGNTKSAATRRRRRRRPGPWKRGPLRAPPCRSARRRR